jgi:ribosomal protein S2
MQELMKLESDGILDTYPKKEAIVLRKEKAKLEKYLMASRT